MTRVFVTLKEFDVLWKSIGFGDTELRELQSLMITSIENNLKNNKLGGKDNEKGKRKN